MPARCVTPAMVDESLSIAGNGVGTLRIVACREVRIVAPGQRFTGDCEGACAKIGKREHCTWDTRALQGRG